MENTRKQGLVLEGGAMRGLFTAGVMDVLMENGIVFDGIVGVSAGAAFGCNYKSGQIGRVLRYNTTYCQDWRYCSFRSLIKTGDLYGADFCYHELPEQLDLFDDEAFQKNPADFYAVCTDCESGEPVYKKIQSAQYTDLEWIRASASMPLVSRIVDINGQKLLDGGIADSIPLRFMENSGYANNVVVLTQPRSYRKKKNSLLPLMKLALKKYPKVVDAMARRHINYNETLAYIRKQEQEGKVFVISPDEKLDIGRTEKDPDKLRAVYAIGRKAAEAKLGELKRFLHQ
ncbi:MAG: patatin family protein [Ruminococcaceae bacterium]|nr:patatin family protein [Oscillospiraceae bacterium]